MSEPMTIVEALHLINSMGQDTFGIDPVVEIASLAMHDGEKFTGPEFCRLKVNGKEVGPQFAPKDAEQVVTFFLLGVRMEQNGE